jgi:hypothetical protein
VKKSCAACVQLKISILGSVQKIRHHEKYRVADYSTYKLIALCNLIPLI